MPHFMALAEAQQAQCLFAHAPHYPSVTQQVVAQLLEEALAKHRPDLLVG